MRKSKFNYPVPKLQDVVRQSDPITQNQWYDGWDGSAVAAGAGSKKKNVLLLAIAFEQAVANEDLEIRIIADNYDVTLSQAAVAGTNYHINVVENPDSAEMLEISTTSRVVTRAFLLKCRELQVMYRKTSATGANDTVIKILYANWE